MVVAQPVSIELGPLNLCFYRTCRVPNRKGPINQLPGGLGAFPVYKVRDFLSNVPECWNKEGYFLSMHPHEAMWISFGHPSKEPAAILVGAGRANAVTGTDLSMRLSQEQNYLVVPPQRWLDGFKPFKGEEAFQFIATKLGSGGVVKDQIPASAGFGGLQIGLFRAKVLLIPVSPSYDFIVSEGNEVGVAAGGSVRQKVYSDPYLRGRSVEEVWDGEPQAETCVYIVHRDDFKTITDQDLPASPITHTTYKEKGLPWLDLPDGSWDDPSCVGLSFPGESLVV